MDGYADYDEFKLELTLDLSRHCLRTELSRQYNRLLSALLRGQARGQGFFVLEVLKWLLQEVDLIGLRGRYPELSGGNACPVFLLVQDGEICIRQQDRFFFKQSLPKELFLSAARP